MLKNLFDTESSRTQTKKPVYEVSMPMHVCVCVHVRMRACVVADADQEAYMHTRMLMQHACAYSTHARACSTHACAYSTHACACSTHACAFTQVRLSTMLAQLDVDMDTFIDFCILCGCDYCGMCMHSYVHVWAVGSVQSSLLRSPPP